MYESMSPLYRASLKSFLRKNMTRCVSNSILRLTISDLDVLKQYDHLELVELEVQEGPPEKLEWVKAKIG